MWEEDLRSIGHPIGLMIKVDGKPIFQWQSKRPLIPASVMKVITAAAALEVMDQYETYTTEVFIRKGALVKNGTLKNDVYLKGQGDPVLSTHDYAKYAQDHDLTPYTDIAALAKSVYDELCRRGVKKIDGRVKGDGSWFCDERDYTKKYLTNPVWEDDIVRENDCGPLSGLQLNHGYSLVLTKDGRHRRELKRQVDPAQYAASVFQRLLKERGVKFTKKARSGTLSPKHSWDILGAIESPPLFDIIARMLRNSDNDIAEMLLKGIGRRKKGTKKGSERASAVKSARKLLGKKLGPLGNDIVIADGSGLSYHNRLTCEFVVRLLASVPPDSPLKIGLPVSGKTGTLRDSRPDRYPGVCGELNTVRAKTGTLKRVSSLAGWTVAANGQTVTFAMIANTPGEIDKSTMARIRMALVNAMANYPYGL